MIHLILDYFGIDSWGTLYPLFFEGLTKVVQLCYYCNDQIPAFLAFCPNCGEPLATCPFCGRYNSSLTNFCFRCENELPVNWNVSSEWLKSLTIRFITVHFLLDSIESNGYLHFLVQEVV